MPIPALISSHRRHTIPCPPPQPRAEATSLTWYQAKMGNLAKHPNVRTLVLRQSTLARLLPLPRGPARGPRATIRGTDRRYRPGRSTTPLALLRLRDWSRTMPLAGTRTLRPVRRVRRIGLLPVILQGIRQDILRRESIPWRAPLLAATGVTITTTIRLLLRDTDPLRVRDIIPTRLPRLTAAILITAAVLPLLPRVLTIRTTSRRTVTTPAPLLRAATRRTIRCLLR